MPSKEQIEKLVAVVGEAVSHPSAPQFAVANDFPKAFVHYERYGNHIELHIEPTVPSSSSRQLADYLKENLPDNEDASIVNRDFCFFAYMLKEQVAGWDDIIQMGNAFLKLKAIVNPYLEQYFCALSSRADLAHAFATYYEDLKKESPFHINVIDELHADENAHSRILVRLLQYSNGDVYPFLKSFVSLIPGWNEEDISISNPEISFNSEHIDALIEEKGKYAIIIENKIHGAQDQEKQIERYVDTAIVHGIPSEKIWALYVTRDGRKVVADFSLTPRTKELIGDRFVAINYRNNILPWLKDIVLPSCPEKEEWLQSALKQYIDHLEGLLEVRPSSVELRDRLLRRIYENLHINDISNSVEVYRSLKNESDYLEAIHEVIIGELDMIDGNALHSFDLFTKQFFHRKFPNREFNFFDCSSRGYYQIYPKDWFWGPHLEWVQFNRGYLITENQIALRLHIENTTNPKVKQLVDCLLADEDFNSSKHPWHGTRTKDEYFSLWMNLPKPFITLSESEQEERLTKVYEEACAIIPIIDRIIHSIE